MMDLNYVKKLIKLLSASAIDEIEIEEDGKRVRVARHVHNSAPAAILPAQTFIPASPSPIAPSSSSVVISHTPTVPGGTTSEAKYHEVRSPIVGTFHRSPAPDADPYVEVGQAVQTGTVLCIIEAMKLMNEIESDVAGRIVKIHVENGQPVEYNQVLFSVAPL